MCGRLRGILVLSMADRRCVGASRVGIHLFWVLELVWSIRGSLTFEAVTELHKLELVLVFIVFLLLPIPFLFLFLFLLVCVTVLSDELFTLVL